MRAVICSLWTWPHDSLLIYGIGIKLCSVNETMILITCSFNSVVHIFLPWLFSVQCLSKLDTNIKRMQVNVLFGCYDNVLNCSPFSLLPFLACQINILFRETFCK